MEDLEKERADVIDDITYSLNCIENCNNSSKITELRNDIKDDYKKLDAINECISNERRTR